MSVLVALGLLWLLLLTVGMVVAVVAGLSSSRREAHARQQLTVDEQVERSDRAIEAVEIEWLKELFALPSPERSR